MTVRNRDIQPATHFRRRLRQYGVFGLSVAVMITVWQIASSYIGLEIILPRPASVLRELARIPSEHGFLASLEATILRGLAGFGLSAAAGFLVGLSVGLSRDVESAVKPLLTLIQSTPVMSVILLALIWFQTGGVPVFVAFLMAFPVIAVNVSRGIREVDASLVEMAGAYRVPWRRTILRVYIPSVGPYIMAAGSIALGLTWRVVIAAEVLSQPVFGIGTQLQQARVELETARVFAWTAIAVLLTGLSDGLFFFISRAARNVHRQWGGRSSKGSP